MASNATQLGHWTARHLTRAVSAIAITAGLLLGGGALAAAPASASAHTGTDNSNVSIQSWQGPFSTWQICNNDRNAAIYQGYRTTPCTHDPDGWYYQIY